MKPATATEGNIQIAGATGAALFLSTAERLPEDGQPTWGLFCSSLEALSSLSSRKEIIIIVQTGPRPEIPLYLVSFLSPQGTSELISKDAGTSIRRTGQDFQYPLVIQRAYEEGEVELLAEEGGEDGAGDALDTNKDEKTFLLDQSLNFRSEIKNNGEKVFAWQDLSGDPGDTRLLNHSKTANP